MLSGCLKKTTLRLNDNASSEYNNSHELSRNDQYKELCTSSWTSKKLYCDEYEIRQQEARLIDIPIPIHADSLGFHEQRLTDGNSNSLVLAYRVHLKQRDIRNFFEIEMERLGWNMIANVQDVESLQVFVKPTKVCAISLRDYYPKDASSLVVITCGNNKAGYSQE